jgi:hypothetical protein
MTELEAQQKAREIMNKYYREDGNKLEEQITNALIQSAWTRAESSQFEKDAEDLMWKASAEYHDKKICESLGIPPPTSAIVSISDEEIEKRFPSREECLSAAPEVGFMQAQWDACYRWIKEHISENVRRPPTPTAKESKDIDGGGGIVAITVTATVSVSDEEIIAEANKNEGADWTAGFYDGAKWMQGRLLNTPQDSK